MPIGIHAAHRRMAEIMHMCTDARGVTIIGPVEIKLLLPLLRKNLELVRTLDEQKELSFVAYLTGDTAWQHELSQRIEDLELELLREDVRV